MRKVAAKYECEPLPVSPALMQALSSYSWPGNLRELENTIKRYLVLADDRAIIEELNPAQRTGLAVSTGDGLENDRSLKHLVRNLKGGAEAAAIAQSLEGSGWNRKAAASDLQISYKALLYKIKQYNLSPPPRKHQASVEKHPILIAPKAPEPPRGELLTLVVETNAASVQYWDNSGSLNHESMKKRRPATFLTRHA